MPKLNPKLKRYHMNFSSAHSTLILYFYIFSVQKDGNEADDRNSDDRNSDDLNLISVEKDMGRRTVDFISE